MSQLILYLLSAFGVLFFLLNKKVVFLLIATFIVYNGFGTLDSAERTNLDAYIFMTVSILAIQYISSIRNNKRTKLNKIGFALILVLLYMGLRSFFSIVIGEETPLFSVKVLRTDLFLLSFFVFVHINNKDIMKFLKILIIFLLPVGVIYGISFIGWLESGQTTIYINRTPILALSAPLIFMLVFDKIILTRRIILIAIFSIFLIMTFSRGIILAVGISFAYYFIRIRKVKKAILPIIIFIPLFYLFFSMLDKNKSTNVSGMNTVEEIQYATSLNSYNDFQEGASFGLRYAMVWEKLSYMVSKPELCVVGVGSIHEDSPNNRFAFSVGSYKMNGNIRTKQQIDTDDVALLSHLFRYGFIWLLLFLYFLKVSFNSLKNHRDMPFVISAELMLVCACVVGFSNDFFSTLSFMFMPLILISRASPNMINNDIN